jgi:hypothetical protein
VLQVDKPMIGKGSSASSPACKPPTTQVELVVTKVKVLELEFTSSKLSNVLIIENCFDLEEIKNPVMPFGCHLHP